jgi:hypothetical protein
MWLGPKVPRRGVGAAKGNDAAVEISTGELRRELTVSPNELELIAQKG